MEITKEMLYTASQAANHQQLRVMYDAMKSERDALAAQADALRVALSNLHDIAARCDSWEYFPQTALDDASGALSATPQHHLRQVRADAGRDGFIAGYFHYKNYGFQFEEELEAASNQYQASILAGKE